MTAKLPFLGSKTILLFPTEPVNKNEPRKLHNYKMIIISL
jgi:hypothetical protein